MVIGFKFGKNQNNLYIMILYINQHGLVKNLLLIIWMYHMMVEKTFQRNQEQYFKLLIISFIKKESIIIGVFSLL